MLDRQRSRATREEVVQTPPGERVGAIGATERAMPLYTPGREAVTYGRAGLWIVIGILALLFAVFFGLFLFLH